MRRCKLVLIGTFLLIAGRALAQEEVEPSAILEIGGAAQTSLKDGGSSFGPNFSIETTPIEHWLEVEAGVTPMFSPHQTEWDADFLFKKPYTWSDTLEFMFGVGPEWEHTVRSDGTMDSVSGEVALDFMYWPWEARKFGLYVEPSYDYGFSKGHEQSLAVSAGLLIPIP